MLDMLGLARVRCNYCASEASKILLGMTIENQVYVIYICMDNTYGP